jgi:hypothetical protein
MVLTLGAPAAALAKDGDGGGDNDVRVAGTCGKGATSHLRVRGRDEGIEVRFEVEHIRHAGSWRVSIVREGRVAFRGRVRARRSFEIRRRLSDYSGADRITVRAVGPRGLTCAASATLPD